VNLFIITDDKMILLFVVFFLQFMFQLNLFNILFFISILIQIYDHDSNPQQFFYNDIKFKVIISLCN